MLEVGNRCSVVGCTTVVFLQELCGKHYKRWQRHKDVNYLGKQRDWGQRSKHPLYSRWATLRRYYPDEMGPWYDDFQAFVSGVGEMPERHNLHRKDRAKPYSKDNCFWKPIIVGAGSPDAAVRNAYMRQYVAQNKRRLWGLWIKKKYGVTADQYEELFEQQKGLCKICGKPETTTHRNGKPFSLAVDHCHRTKKVRGLLCHLCNRGLGFFQDNVELLESAIRYLKS